MSNYWNLIKEKLLKEKGVLSIGFSDIVGAGISAGFWFYVASVVTPENYGEIHYFLGIAGLVQIVSMIGNSHSLTVYSAKNENIQSTLFLLSIIPTIISCLIIGLLFNRIDTGILALGYVIFESVNAVTLGKKFYSKYAKLIIIQKILTVILGIGFLYGFGYEGIIFALGLTFVPHMIIFIKEFKNNKVQFNLLKSKKNFIINNYIVKLSGGLGGQIDKIILAPLLGFTLLGNYSLSLQIFSILVIFSSISFKYLLPQDSSGISNKNLKKILILISIGISILGITVLPKIIPIFFPKFIQAVDAISIMSIAIVPETITMLYMSKILGKEKSKIILISKLISLSILIIGFILIGPIMGIIGLSIIMVLASISQTSILALSEIRVRERNGTK
jgi:O-antigen/teichoic acid export membrane protein